MKDDLTGLDDSEGWKEHAEWHYAQEDRMTRMDWVKSIGGGILVAALFWGFTAFMFVL